MPIDHLLLARASDDVASAASGSSPSSSRPDDVAANNAYRSWERDPRTKRVTQPLIKLDDTCGLYELYPTGPPGPAEVDVVAVHGLNGGRMSTWTHKKGKIWLQDFLPARFSSARVMTFGYNSKVAFCKSQARIEDYSRLLLQKLMVVRRGKVANRPLIFVAHSLGGIVVKEALTLASMETQWYSGIASSTLGVIFMGTPHKGAKIAKVTAIIGSAVNVISIGLFNVINTRLLKLLKPDSLILSDIAKRWKPYSGPPLAIKSFIETDGFRGLSFMVVPQESATLSTKDEPLANEEVIATIADHEGICRYPSTDDDIYVQVQRVFEDILHPSNTQPATASPPQSNPQTTYADTIDAEEPDEQEATQTLKIHFRQLESNKILTTVEVSADTTIADLKASLQQEIQNFGPRDMLRFPGRRTPILSTWTDVFTIPAVVTSGRSCYSQEQGFKINQHEKLISFMNKALRGPVEAELQHRPGARNGSSDTVVISQDGLPGMYIQMLRTARVPEDGKEHPAPRGEGSLEMFNLLPFGGKLSADALTKGGVFVPMHRTEAMSMSFQCFKAEYAIRPFVGCVNGLSGEIYTHEQPRAEARSTDSPQDYMVSSREPTYLHGVAVKPGSVKQFVATDLTPESNDPGNPVPWSEIGQRTATAGEEHSMKTIEYQMTGKDVFGGIQLEIIPRSDEKRFVAGNTKDICQGIRACFSHYSPLPVDSQGYNVSLSPAALGLDEGSVIHLKDLWRIQDRRPKVVGDLFAEAPTPPASTNELTLEVLPQGRAVGLFQVFIQTPKGAVRTLDVNPDDTVGVLRLLLEDVEGTPQESQSLVFAGKQLKEERTLTEYNIQHQDKIWLVFRLVGGGAEDGQYRREFAVGEWTETLVVRFERKTYSVKVGTHDTIGVLKRRLYDLVGVFPGYQSLTADRYKDELADDLVIRPQTMKNMFLTIRPVAVTYLGIGAGGNIAQHIPRDATDASRWDFDGSRVLTINILEAEAFQRITGVAAPPSPFGAAAAAGRGAGAPMAALARLEMEQERAQGWEHGGWDDPAEQTQESEEEIDFMWGVGNERGTATYNTVILQDVDSTFPRYRANAGD